MKLPMSLFFLTLFITCNCLQGHAQTKIKSAQIQFYTPAHDDKDWDTKVVVTLYQSDGTLIGTADYNLCDDNTPPISVSKCFCCVAPKYDGRGQMTNANTMFANGSTKGAFEILLSNFVLKDKIKTGFFKVKVNPNGNDRWIFIPELTLNFDDGTNKVFRNYSTTIVAQDASEATLVFF